MLAAEHEQIALHDDAPAWLDHQLADVDHVEQVIALVDAQHPVLHGEIPDLGGGHAPVQHAQQPGGEREAHGQPVPVGVVDAPVGEDVGLAPVVHALAEAASDGDGGMEEDRLSRPALGRADLAELAGLLEGRDGREGLGHLAGQQPGGVVAEPAGAGQERADLLVRQVMPPGGHGITDARTEQAAIGVPGPAQLPRRWIARSLPGNCTGISAAAVR